MRAGPEPGAVSPWIFGRAADLALLLGGPVAGLGLLASAAALGEGFTPVWFIWVALLDTPHYFGTYARAFLDRVEFHERRRLYLRSFAWLALGPTALLVGWGLQGLGLSSWHEAPWHVFLLAFSIWAYLHVVRQHYGFLRLYHAKDPGLDPAEGRIDAALLYVGQLLPVSIFAFRHPELRALAGLPATPGNEPWRIGLEWGALGAIGSLCARFAAGQLRRHASGQALHAPKILLLVGVVSLAGLACLTPPATRVPLFAFAAFVTLYHDVQYQAIAFFQQRNRHLAAEAQAARHGPAVFFSRRPAAWIAAGLLFGASARWLGCGLGVHPGCDPWLPSATLPLFGSLHLDALFASVFLGVAMQHYFLDQHLWRLKGNQQLRRELGLALPASSPLLVP